MSEEPKPAWYETQGYAGAKREEERKDLQYNMPDRFWLPNGASKEVVFVDDVPLGIYEHQARINGDFKNWFTCSQGMGDEVPCCDKLGGKSRYYVGYYTVIDMTPWKDGKGKVHQYDIKFLAAKTAMLKKFERKKSDRNNSLVGVRFKVNRDGEKSPGIGDEYEFQDIMNLSELFQLAMYRGKRLQDIYSKAPNVEADFQKLKNTFQLKLDGNGKPVMGLNPFNYYKLLAPLEVSAMKMALVGASTSDFSDKDKPVAGATTKASDADEEVPF